MMPTTARSKFQGTTAHSRLRERPPSLTAPWHPGKGKKAERFLQEAKRVAERKNRGVGDVAHCSSVTWGDIGDKGLASKSLEA